VRRLWQNFGSWLFRPDSDDWLIILRWGLGLELVLYCLSLRDDWNHLFAGGGYGLISRDLTEAVSTIDSPFIPTLSWITTLGERVGLNESTSLSIAWGLLLCAGCLLIAGLFCRTAAIGGWLLHLCAVKSGDFLAYGMDNFTTIGLFYLMLAPLPDRLSLDARLWRPSKAEPEILGFYRRVLQLHLCIIYFFSGLTKCLGAGWWTGATLWRALTRPPFNVFSPEILLPWHYLFPILGVLVCVLETLYPIFIWPRKTRTVWLAGIVAMHISIGVAMGLYLFALIMIVLNLAGFGAHLIFRRSEPKVSVADVTQAA
jgi:hypothetical protein